MEEKELQKNSLTESELESISGGETLARITYDKYGHKSVSLSSLSKGAYNFLKKRGYNVYKDGVGGFSYAGDGDCKEVLNLLDSNGYRIFEESNSGPYADFMYGHGKALNRGDWN